MSCCTDTKEEHEVGWACRKCGEEQQLIQEFEKKQKGRRTLRILLSRKEDNIKINLMERGWEVVDWTGVHEGTVSTGPL